MIRRSRLAWYVGLMNALLFGPSIGRAEDDVWVGRDFVPKATCRPKIGTQEVALDRLALPLRVQKVEGDWLWIGQAWVKKHDVVVVEDPIEEFDVARYGDFLLVPVTIDGREYQFVVDTGCTCNVVDNSLQPRLLPTGTTTRFKGTTNDRPEYRLPNTFVGKSRLPVKGDAVCVDLEPFRKWSGHDIRGFLGMTFLAEKILRIDFDAGKLAILRSDPIPAGSTFRLSYNRANIPFLNFEVTPNRVVSFRLDTGWLCTDCGNIEPATFDELTRHGTLIDTGRTAQTVSIYGEETVRKGKLKQFRIGRFEHTTLGFEEGRLNALGLGYLSRFVVTFDFRNDRIHLQKGSRFDEKHREDMFGAQTYRVGRDTFLAYVSPSSPAGLGGLREGDRILSVDEMDCAEISLFDLKRFFANDGQRLRLIVQGDEEPRAVEILLADWHAIQAAQNKTERVSE